MGYPGNPINIDPSFGGQHIKRTFCGLSNNTPANCGLFNAGIVTDPTRNDEFGEATVISQRRITPVRRDDSTLRVISGSLYAVGAFSSNNNPSSHLILGERAGFIRTNGRHCTQRFNRFHFSGNRITFSHLLYTQRQCDGDKGRETFRNRSYGKPNGGFKQFFCWGIMDEATNEHHRNG